MKRTFDFGDLDKKTKVEESLSVIKSFEKEWESVQLISTERLKKYILRVKSLQSDPRNTEILTKVKNSLQDFEKSILRFRQLVLCMKKSIGKAKDSTMVKKKGSFGFSDVDRINTAESIVEMFDSELDLKLTILAGLSESESEKTLSTYLVVWKNQPYLDEKKRLKIMRRQQMEWKLALLGSEDKKEKT